MFHYPLPPLNNGMEFWAVDTVEKFNDENSLKCAGILKISEIFECHD